MAPIFRKAEFEKLRLGSVFHDPGHGGAIASGEGSLLASLVTRAVARRSAFGGSLFQFSALAFGRDAFGGGLFTVGLRMNAEIAP